MARGKATLPATKPAAKKAVKAPERTEQVHPDAALVDPNRDWSKDPDGKPTES